MAHSAKDIFHCVNSFNNEVCIAQGAAQSENMKLLRGGDDVISGMVASVESGELDIASRRHDTQAQSVDDRHQGCEPVPHRGAGGGRPCRSSTRGATASGCRRSLRGVECRQRGGPPTPDSVVGRR